MRLCSVFLLVLLGLSGQSLTGQSLNGLWRGTLAPTGNPTQAIPCLITIRITGANVSGNVSVQANGITDQYTLTGKLQGTQATGAATYPADGTVFQFEAALQSGQLLFAIGRNGNALMRGSLVKTTDSADEKTAGTRTKADGLYRDPALVGAWQTTSNYGGGVTDGGFYGSTSSIMILHADGTFGDGGSSGYASGAGVSVQSSGGNSSNGNSTKLNAMGARWHTKGNLFYVRVRVNGQVQDIPASKYYVEKGRMLITDLKTGKKTLYTRP